MLKINCEIIYDDKGMNIYYVDGMYLSGYSFYLYKMIKMLETRRPTRLMYTIDTSTIDKKLVEFKKAFDSFMSKDESTMVGPFFYIDDKIIAKTKSIGLFNDNLEFFDHELGHFDWFYNELVNELGLGENDDYGMYYRGRVLYDNKKGDRFGLLFLRDFSGESIKGLFMVYIVSQNDSFFFIVASMILYVFL